jgi:hypothetical protein
MGFYPEILLPKPSYPLFENKEVSDYALVREIPVDVYAFLMAITMNVISVSG